MSPFLPPRLGDGDWPDWALLPSGATCDYLQARLALLLLLQGSCEVDLAPLLGPAGVRGVPPVPRREDSATGKWFCRVDAADLDGLYAAAVPPLSRRPPTPRGPPRVR